MCPSAIILRDTSAALSSSEAELYRLGSGTTETGCAAVPMGVRRQDQRLLDRGGGPQGREVLGFVTGRKLRDPAQAGVLPLRPGLGCSRCGQTTQRKCIPITIPQSCTPSTCACIEPTILLDNIASLILAPTAPMGVCVGGHYSHGHLLRRRRPRTTSSSTSCLVSVTGPRSSSATYDLTLGRASFVLHGVSHHYCGRSQHSPFCFVAQPQAIP